MNSLSNIRAALPQISPTHSQASSSSSKPALSNEEAIEIIDRNLYIRENDSAHLRVLGNKIQDDLNKIYESSQQIRGMISATKQELTKAKQLGRDMQNRGEDTSHIAKHCHALKAKREKLTDTLNKCNYQTGKVNQLKETYTDSLKTVTNTYNKDSNTKQSIQNGYSAPDEHTITPLMGRSSVSKYREIHNVILQLGGVVEPVLELDIILGRQHANEKGTSVDNTYIDIENPENDSLRETLSTIPVNGAAVSNATKHTKIALISHGNINELSAKSAYEDKHKTIPDNNVAKLLSDHLPRGNYHGKLTIAVKSCFGGSKEEGGISTVETIAHHLRNSGYAGIKITGMDGTIGVISESSDKLPLGSTAHVMGNYDNAPHIKSSQSEVKMSEQI